MSWPNRLCLSSTVRVATALLGLGVALLVLPVPAVGVAADGTPRMLGRQPEADAQAMPLGPATDRVGRLVLRSGKVVILAPGSRKTARAQCRSGETLVGGGAEFQYAYGLQTSGPAASHRRRWIATAVSPAFESFDLELRAYVYCAAPARRDRVGSIRLVTGPPVAGTPLAWSTVSCPTGRKLVGGGSLSTGLGLSGVFLGTSAPDRFVAGTWQSIGYDGDTSSADTIQAYAYCARKARPDRVGRIVRRAGEARTVSADSDRDAFARCRSGERLVGGGAVGTGPDAGYGVQLRISAPDPNNARRWFVRGFNGGPSAQTLRAFAFCAARA